MYDQISMFDFSGSGFQELGESEYDIPRNFEVTHHMEEVENQADPVVDEPYEAGKVVDFRFYSKDGQYLGPPPEGYEYAKTFKKDGTRKLVHKHSNRDGEQKAYPIIEREHLESMASWLYKNKERKYLLAYVLGINLGLRANELLELRKHDLFLPDGTIRYIESLNDTSDSIRVYQKKTRNSKVSRYRSVFLNSACVDILDWYFPDIYSRLYTEHDIKDDKNSIILNHCRGGKDIIFTSRNGGSISVDMLRKVLKEAANACGLPQNIATHTLRKTFALSAGTRETIGGMNIDVAKVQRLLCHGSGATSLRYLSTNQMSDKADYHSTVLDVAKNLFSL